jgi:rhamnulokinase
MRGGVCALGVDLGASGGRCLLGCFDGNSLAVEEIHRFGNRPVSVANHLKWNLFLLFQEIKRGLGKLTAREDVSLSSLGIDTWGVDFGLLDSTGDILLMPHHYRDSRTHGMVEIADARFGVRRIYEKTGVAFQPFNTSLQLLSLAEGRPHVLEAAATMLMIPDLLTYLLTGEIGTEYTIASTTQLLNTTTKRWEDSIIDALGVPRRIFTELHSPGTRRGVLRKRILEECRLEPIPVYAVGTHDSASATVSIPKRPERTAFISSGTWSLIGIETEEPVTTEEARIGQFTNEGAVGGGYCFLRNVMGLWLVQECVRSWERTVGPRDFDRLTHMAESSEPFLAFIDPDDTRFYPPGNMAERIFEFCRASGQPVPSTEGAVLRCIYESLALVYHETVLRLEELTGSPVERIHVVGGGSQNRLLNQLTADVTGKPLYSGPTEATAIGNITVQMEALGAIRGRGQIDDLVRRSFAIEEYLPIHTGEWDEAFERYRKICRNDQR